MRNVAKKGLYLINVQITTIPSCLCFMFGWCPLMNQTVDTEVHMVFGAVDSRLVILGHSRWHYNQSSAQKSYFNLLVFFSMLWCTTLYYFNKNVLSCLHHFYTMITVTGFNKILFYLIITYYIVLHKVSNSGRKTCWNCEFLCTNRLEPIYMDLCICKGRWSRCTETIDTSSEG